MGKFLAVASFHNNPDEHIDLTFKNVLNQTHKNWLLIVGDDHSTDPEFKRRLKRKVEELNDPRILYHQVENRRELYLYQNMFLEHQYDYYLDLDSDDEINPMLFEMYDRHFCKYPEVFSIFSDYHQVTDDGSLEQWSLVQEPDNWLTEWQFRHNEEFWTKYSNRNTQKAFGAGRAMRRPDVKSLPIQKECKTATDTFFLFYNLTRGKHLHLPRNLYTYNRRSGSDSGALSQEESTNFNINAQPFMDSFIDPGKVGIYNDVWHITSAISTCEWLEVVNSFSVWSSNITKEQEDKIKMLYPDKTIVFNQQHNNIILAWSAGFTPALELGTFKRLSVLVLNDATGDTTTHEMLNQYGDQQKAIIEELIPGGSWYYFFRQQRYTIIKESKKELEVEFFYRNGPELRCGYIPEGEYKAQFLQGGNVRWTRTIQTSFWARYSEDWFQDWECRILKDGEEVMSIKPDVSDFGVKLDSSSLGDTLSWMGQVEELVQHRDFNKIVVKCAKNWLFNREYYRSIGIDIVEWNDPFPNNYQCLGVYQKEGDPSPRDKHPRDWRTIPLGAIAADQLGIPYKERKPKLAKEFYQTPIDDNKPKHSVCIATQSTAQAKYWNREGGWQSLIDKFKAKDWDVFYVSKEPTDLEGVTHIEDLFEAGRQIRTSNKFIGISSGLSWLAWALDVDVCLISGFTWDFVEFNCDIRIINHNVCSGCWSYTVFDRGDWNWCPIQKGTPKQFECTKTISPEYVFQEIETSGWFNI